MDWKKCGKKLLFPPVWLMVLLTAVSAAGLVTVFCRGWDRQVMACFVYVTAFYTLCVVTVRCAMVLPKGWAGIRRRIDANPLATRYVTDKAFRGRISLYESLTVNLLYVGINLWSWGFSRSWWFVVLAVYYAIMAVMRFLLVGFVRAQKLGVSIPGEWKRARVCACVLLLVNLSLSGAVLMILYQDRGYDYPGIMIYVMALYTFYALTHAIVDLFRYRALGSPVMSTAKVVSLSAALVSMLNLETAMFAQFGGEMSEAQQHIFIILTGAGVSAAVVTLSVILIVKATNQIRRQKYGQ